jgi:hypothetical protein
MGSSFFYSSRLGSNCPASWFFLIRPGYGAVSERALETAGMMFFAGFIHVSSYVSQKYHEGHHEFGQNDRHL